MPPREYPSIAGIWDSQPMRREQDHITVVEARIRSLLLGGKQGELPTASYIPFSEALHVAAAQLALGMHETLVEIWLIDTPPWGDEHAEHPLRACASIAARASHASQRGTQPPDDLLLDVVTAGRPLRYDDAIAHPLVRGWATSAGIDPDAIVVFLGVPLHFHDELLGVLAVGLAESPSPEHVSLIDATAAYIAMGAEYARSQFRLHSQQELAQTVLREAPIAAAVLKPRDYTIVLTNPYFDRLLNIGPDVWGQRLDAVLPDHAQLLRTSLRLDDVVRSGETRTILELSIRLASGLTYWDFTCSPIRNASGAIEGVLVAGVEVTARVQQRQREKYNVEVAQERVSHMVTLHQVSLDVASQLGQDPQDLLRLIVQRMATLVGAPGGMVYYANRETGDLEVVVSHGLTKDYIGTQLHRNEGLAGRVAVTGEGQWVNDYRRYPLRATVFANEPFGAVAAVPMKQRNQVIGVICLIYEIIPRTTGPLSTGPLAANGAHATGPLGAGAGSEPEQPHFTNEDIRLLELFASQAAHAIENARTYLDLERAYQQQRALDREKDDFIARVSHDLRLPLTGVVGFLDLVLDTDADVPLGDLRPLLQQAADEAQRLTNMMDQMLSQARLDSGKRGVHLTAIRLATALSEIIRSRQKQVALRMIEHLFLIEVPETIIVRADMSRLKETLENLVSNAVKYSPQGGAIRITAETTADDEALVHISDQGIGIPYEAHERIFDRFTRHDSPLVSQIRGTGLGLYLSRQFIESMNGQLWLEQSEPGRGSVFAFTLPLADPSAMPDALE